MDEKGVGVGVGLGKDLINEWPRPCECEGGKVYLYYSWLGAIASGLSTDMHAISINSKHESKRYSWIDVKSWQAPLSL